MRILVIGGGAREHALVWKIKQSPRVTELLVAPGNGGTASIAENVPIPATDTEALVALAIERKVDLVVVGPEDPLARGVVDAMQQKGVPVFGPTKAAAEIEWSKAFANDLMHQNGVPTSTSETFVDHKSAQKYLEAQKLPIVVKADGLAAGKGVVVARTREEARDALRDMMVEGAFGGAGNRVVIEECLEGMEASVFAFCDGENMLMTLPACDYKPAYDGDAGPNTGGMGGYSPPEFVSDALLETVRRTVMEPTLRGLRDEGRPFVGVLYGGLMIKDGQPKVIEFNSRLGDPETQLILPRLKNDIVDVIEACLQGNVASLNLEWSDDRAVAVVIASPGYPGPVPSGLPISGLDDLDDDVLAFHAGTAISNENLVTTGGRVLTIVGFGATIAEARKRAYDNVDRVRIDGAHFRTDIAARAEGII